jgi:nucleoside-diphosphate-sugar epimerase
MSATTTPGERLFCFGYGFTASALGRQLAGEGWCLAGTCREPNKRESLAAAGIDATVFGRGTPLADPRAALAGASHILLSVPPDATGDPVLDCHGADIAATASVRWIGYLSTTGVYGDTGGAWVDETARPAPSNDRSKRRVAAEEAWLAFGTAHDVAVQVFRLAGIYGPGRNALTQARAGTAKRVDKPGHVFSRIHVDDIARVLIASIAAPNPGAIYNVCDDEPAASTDVVTHACSLLGTAPPPLVGFEDAALSPMARSFYADNRRVSNGRIKTELGVELLYPDYRAGLAALYETETLV